MGIDTDTNLHIVLLQNTINMTIHQLSIFIENKNGILLRVLDILKEAKIQIIASTISDTVDYGIFRIICSNPSQAYKLLQEHGLSVTISDVFAIELDNTPGQAAKAFTAFTANGVNISYMYSFLVGGKGIIIFRTDATEKAREIIMQNALRFISEDKLSQLSL